MTKKFTIKRASFFVRRFLITDINYLLLLGTFIFSISSWLSFISFALLEICPLSLIHYVVKLSYGFDTFLIF